MQRVGTGQPDMLQVWKAVYQLGKPNYARKILWSLTGSYSSSLFAEMMCFLFGWHGGNARRRTVPLAPEHAVPSRQWSCSQETTGRLRRPGRVSLSFRASLGWLATRGGGGFRGGFGFGGGSFPSSCRPLSSPPSPLRCVCVCARSFFSFFLLAKHAWFVTCRHDTCFCALVFFPHLF